MFPTSIRRAARRCMNAGGRDFARRSTAARATAERSGPSPAATSSRSTLAPALASWAAIPPPITPEPMTATRSMVPPSALN